MKIFRIIRRVGRYSLLAFLLFLLMVSAFLWYITTNSFQESVRSRMIASIERATGGRVEIGSFHVVPWRFEVEVRDLTIHGRESAGERPLAHVDSMSAVVDLSSALGARMAFRRVLLSHPVVHIICYPDGTTNRPVPSSAAGATFDKMFAISVSRLEVHRGELFLQEQLTPIDFIANDVQATLNYSFLHRRYSGDLAIGRAEMQLAGYRPFSWAAKTEFNIGRDEIQLLSLNATSEGSGLKGKGIISDFRHPTFKGSYDLILNLQQVAAIVRQPRTATGKLEARGSADWSSENYRTAGDFELKDGGWSDPRFTSKDVSATGKFVLDPQTIKVSHIQGRALRGTFKSDLEVSGWDPRTTPSRSGKQLSQRGSVVLRANDVSLTDLIGSLGTQVRNAKAMQLVGSVSTETELRWKDSLANAEVNSSISVARPPRVSQGQMPLSATAKLQYQSRPASLTIADLTANTPATHLRASGTLSNNSDLRLSLSTDSVGELSPLISSVFPQGLPIEIAGNAGFTGRVGGSFERPVFNGNLQLHDFDTSISRNGGSPEIIHWDSLNSGIQLSADDLVFQNAVLRRDNAVMDLNGSVGLVDWNAQPNSSIRFNARADSFEASDLEVLAGQHWSAQGTVNARVELNGTLSQPRGQASVNWANGSLRGYSFDTLKTTLSLANDRATIASLDVARGNARVSGRGWYDLRTRSFDVDVNGTNFDIAEIAPLEHSRVKLTGAIDFSAKLSGAAEIPNANAHVQFRNLAFNGETAGDYLIDAITRGNDLHLTGHSQFSKSELLIEGDVKLRELWPARIDFHFNHLDIDSFLTTYLRGHVTGHSAVAGDLVLQGPLRDPRRLKLVGNLTDLYADVEKVKIRNDGPVTFALDQQILNVTSLHLIGENTDLSLAGSVQLAGEQQLNLRGTGKVGLQLLQTYDPDLTGSGTIVGQVTASGTLGAPVFRGSLQVENASVADINLPSALSELNGTLQFNQNQITIEKLTGRTGGGTVSFTGNAQLDGKSVSFDLKADADSVRLRYPPGVSSTATASLRWAGSSNGSLLSGDISVIKLGVTPGFDFGAYLVRTVQSSGLPQTDPVLNNIRLDLHVVTVPDLQMQTSVIRLRGDADMRVRGNAAKPVLLGRADIFEGEAYFNGTKYRVERGGITFGAPSGGSAAASVPVVDLEATTHVRDYDITLSITGPADRPKMNYRSEPPLPTNDIIGLLAFGQTTEESAQLQQSSQSAFSQQASSAMLTAALNATLNNRTQRLFGNSRIKIDPHGLETETSPTQSAPAVTIEQQVKDNFTVTYTTNVAQTSQQIIRGEYFVSRSVSIVGIRDQNGVVSFEVKIRRRKR